MPPTWPTWPPAATKRHAVATCQRLTSLTTAISIVERHQESQRHRRTADAILAGQKKRAAADRSGPGPESAAIVANHAAAEALRSIRAGRQAPARVHLRDGERLRVR